MAGKHALPSGIIRLIRQQNQPFGGQRNRRFSYAHSYPYSHFRRAGDRRRGRQNRSAGAYLRTVERFGRYKTLQPGLSLVKMRLWTELSRKINMMEQVLDIPSQEVIQKRPTSLSMRSASIQVIDAPRAAYEVSNPNWRSVNLTMTNIRTVLFGSMELDEMLSSATASTRGCCILSMKLPTRGEIKVTRIEIRDVRPPAELIPL
ncbi:hypothetical protein KCP74_24085 [Salmonella enterica subsp. enterica]|nr:hypothetical protein KCP74_24085 [Salmonella enterica subsp. enterica]